MRTMHLVLQATGIRLIVKKVEWVIQQKKQGFSLFQITLFIYFKISLFTNYSAGYTGKTFTNCKIEASNSHSYLPLVRESIPPEARWSNVKLPGLNSSCSNREAKIWIVHPWVRSVSSI